MSPTRSPRRSSNSSIGQSVFYPSYPTFSVANTAMRLTCASISSGSSPKSSRFGINTTCGGSASSPHPVSPLSPLSPLAGGNTPLVARYERRKSSLSSESGTPEMRHPNLPGLNTGLDSPLLTITNHYEEEGGEFPFGISEAFGQLHPYGSTPPIDEERSFSFSSKGSGSDVDVLLTSPTNETSSLRLGTVIEENMFAEMNFSRSPSMLDFSTFEQKQQLTSSLSPQLSPSSPCAPLLSPTSLQPSTNNKRPSMTSSKSWTSVPRLASRTSGGTSSNSTTPTPIAKPRSPALGSPVGGPGSGSLSPLQRQLWANGRRASAPSLTPLINITPVLEVPITPFSEQSVLDTAQVSPNFETSDPFLNSLFSADYTMQFPSPLLPTADYTFPPVPCLPSNSLNLNFDHIIPAPGLLSPVDVPATISPSAIEVPNPVLSTESEVAAVALENHCLNVEFEKRYTIGDELGHGGFGFVCAATQTGYDNKLGEEVAVKFIYKERFNSSYGVMHDGEPLESAILKMCSGHPHIVQWKGLYEDEKFYVLVMELHGDPWSPGHTLEPETDPKLPHSATMPNLHSPSPALSATPPTRPSRPPTGCFTPVSGKEGWAAFADNTGVASPLRPYMGRRASYDLFECVEHLRFSENQARYVFKQIVEAVHFMHQRRIYHRDLKDENCVIDRDLNVKIIDFGSAVVEDPKGGPVIYHDFRGTSSYAPPEALAGEDYFGGPCDMWALGIILSILLTGQSPFLSPDDARAVKITLKRSVSKTAKDLIKRCLVFDHYRRATIEEIIQHEWLRGPMWTRNSI